MKRHLGAEPQQILQSCAGPARRLFYRRLQPLFTNTLSEIPKNKRSDLHAVRHLRQRSLLPEGLKALGASQGLSQELVERDRGLQHVTHVPMCLGAGGSGPGDTPVSSRSSQQPPRCWEPKAQGHECHRKDPRAATTSKEPLH